jgi:hypothetical protein
MVAPIADICWQRRAQISRRHIRLRLRIEAQMG